MFISLTSKLFYLSSSTPIFYSALWECILTNPAIRISALDYVIVRCMQKIDLSYCDIWTTYLLVNSTIVINW